MKKNLYIWQFGAFAITSFLGTILHYLYDWTDKSIFIAPFSAVNESTFEHMKLLYFPLLIFAVFQSFFFKEVENFWCIKLKGALLGLILIPIIFYTLNGCFGKTPDFINISIFFIADAVLCLFETKLFKQNKPSLTTNKFCFFIFLFIGIIFVVLTFFTPKLPVFRDPINLTYGFFEK